LTERLERELHPSCSWRLLPEPTIGLPAATSGVVHTQPNVAPLKGSLPPGAIHRSERIGEDGVIQEVKELGLWPAA